jgi:hypothetical protein
MVTKLKMIEYKYDKDSKRTFIVIEEKSGFAGLKKIEKVYVDSNYQYKINKQQVFYLHPEMEQIDSNDPLTKFLNDCLRRIEFEKTGIIIKN